MAAEGLVRYPDGRHEPEAFLCTDTSADPRDVLDCFNRRWAVETTYEEARAHLGMETQRQWSDPAIFRTTPVLLGLYSVVTLYVHQNAERLALSPRRSAWCPKPAPTRYHVAAATTALFRGVGSPGYHPEP